MAVRFVILAVIFAVLCVHLVTGARILFLFAGGNLSHKTVIWPFVLGLANRGHVITFISSHYKTPVPHANVTDLAPEALVQATAMVYGVNRFQARQQGLESETWDEYDEFAQHSCELLLKAGETDEHLRQALYPPSETKYDVVIINAVYGECGFIIATHLRVKYIQYCPTTIESWFHTSFGLPWQASWIPDIAAPLAGSSSPLPFLDRLHNFWFYATRVTRTETVSAGLQALHARYLPESAGPTFIEMERNTSLVLVNTHPTFDFARPLPPWFVQIGGMACWAPVGSLPQVTSLTNRQPHQLTFMRSID